MSTMTSTAQTTQVYSVFIKATPEQIWDAIVKPEFTGQYFYGVPVSVDEKRFDGQDSAQGIVVEFMPPHRLVHSFRATWAPELAEEPESRVTWEIAPQDGGVTQLTVVHDRLEGAPLTAESVAGGWSFILSGLKSVVETGSWLSA